MQRTCMGSFGEAGVIGARSDTLPAARLRVRREALAEVCTTASGHCNLPALRPRLIPEEDEGWSRYGREPRGRRVAAASGVERDGQTPQRAVRTWTDQRPVTFRRL